MKTYCAIVGVLCNFFALWLLLRRLNVWLRDKSTLGTVTNHLKSEMDDTVFYKAVVIFKDENGQAHQFTAVAGHAYPKPTQGEQVPVRYLPANPQLAYIPTFLHMWAAPLAVLGCAALVAWLQ